MRRSADEIGATSISFWPKVFSDATSIVDRIFSARRVTSAEEIAPQKRASGGEDKMTVRNEPAVLLINGAAKNLEDAVRNRSPTAGQKASRGDTNGDNGAAKNLKDAARNRSLTARQRAVLELLSRDDTNKVIARRLG